jgi:predicted enzyme related to lactoylglutathione lyase
MAKRPDDEDPNSATGVDSTLTRHGGLSYLEIPAVDARESAAFFEKILGWTVSWRGANDPRFSDQSGHLIGRWVTGRAISHEPGLLPYIYVNNIDETVARIVVQGGTMVKEPSNEGNTRVAQFRDPAGNLIGIWQAWS